MYLQSSACKSCTIQVELRNCFGYLAYFNASSVTAIFINANLDPVKLLLKSE